jgi:two-component system CheB/CheR fusion protein
VLVSADLEVLQTRGHASRFLELPSGKVSLNLLKMIKPGLLYEVQNAIEEAKKSSAPVRRGNLHLESDGNFSSVNIEVMPFQMPPHSTQNFLLVFEDGTDDGSRRRTEPAGYKVKAPCPSAA